jgi:FkbM family methyltransferase
VIRPRALAKRLVFGTAPFFRGRFRYFDQVVHFPLGSHVFERACEEGIYERDVTNLILNLAEPETTYFDVGANIGLLSVPVLALCPTVKVLSIEPSPATLPFLGRTHLTAERSKDWTVIGAAVGAKAGEAEFWSSGGAMGAFDGLRDTGRGGRKHVVRVPVRTLDDIWREKGCPPVSIMKLDIEGGEYHALQGASELISHEKPVLVIEWAEQNLAAYGIRPEEVLHLCAEMRYVAYACPSLIFIGAQAILKRTMRYTETFILAPANDGRVSNR